MGRASDKQTMLGLIIDAKRTDPETGSFAESLAEHMPTLTPPNEWVSVEERLPELPEKDWCSKMVISCDKNGHVAPMIWERAQVRGKMIERWKYHWDRIYDGAGITHWMPLPAPPGEGNNVPNEPPNEPLTLGLVDKYGAPLYAGDTVTADKFFMYAIRYGSHNVNPKQCEPAYQVGWYLEIVWALYNEDKTYIGHTEALYDIGGVAARYPAHCADTTEGVQNLLLYKHRPPEVSP